jgi:hypothetical protein
MKRILYMRPLTPAQLKARADAAIVIAAAYRAKVAAQESKAEGKEKRPHQN